MFEIDYYNQSSLWRQELEYYQVQLLADILSLIPEGTQSILDVGCGNGLITNALPKDIYVVGVDPSEEALKTVAVEKKVSSIVNLPFPDHSFDLVMANDVIEHLPDDIYLKGVAELFRVASKYVLISVPHAEQLEKSFTKCGDCGLIYHINHHQRSFDDKTLVSLCLPEWQVNEIRYSGDITRPPLDPTLSLQHELKIYAQADNCVCPRCGSSKITKNNVLLSQQIIGKLRSEYFYKEKSLLNQHLNRTEIICLYQQQNIKHTQSSIKKLESQLEEKYISPLYIDTTNFIQQVKQGFVEGCYWSKYYIKHSNNLELDKSIMIYFPVIPKVGDKIIIKLEYLSNDNTTAKASILAHDDLNNTSISLMDIECVNSEDIEITLSSTWDVNTYGAAISINYDKNICIKSAQYILKKDTLLPFVYLNKGHNILFASKSNYQLSWGLFTEQSGYHPKPEWLWTDNLTAFYPFNSSPLSITDYQKQVEAIIHKKELERNRLNATLSEQVNYLSNMLEAKELERTQAESAYTQASEQVNYLSNLLEAKELERTQAENAYTQASEQVNYLLNLLEAKELERTQAENAYAESSKQINHLLSLLDAKEIERSQTANACDKALKYASLFFKNNQRSINRVLVLSHMFPNKNQSNLGCFVAEQVKALRADEGLDVRVISCQPFWCNTKNPLRIARALRKYQEDLNSSEWFLHEDIPTLFVPYLVGCPYIPFPLHGFTYRYTIAKIAKRIRRNFNFDLVHAHTGYLDGFAGLYIARKFNVPFVITEHTNPFSYLTGKPIIRHITHHSMVSADKIIAVSSTLMDEIKEFLPASVHDKLTYFPNGVDTNLFKITTNDAPETYTYGKSLRLLSVTALENYKNPLCLLEAIRILREKEVSIQLILVGEGSLETSVKDWILKHELIDSIQLLGRQSHQSIAKLMRDECDIFVLSSCSETFGVVIIEAMASGKPIVSTRCGGPEGILKEAYLGELCENNNPQSMADTILKVANNYEKYPPQMIRQFAVTNYAFENLTQKIVELYQNILH